MFKNGLALALVAFLALAFPVIVHADLVEIDDAADLDTDGLGDYAPIGGSLAGSAFGQIDDLITWLNNDPDQKSLDDGTLDTVGEFLSLIPGSDPITTLIFGFGVNQTGSTLADAVDMTQLDVLIDSTTFSFGSGDILRVAGYGSGQSDAEAFLQLDLGFDLRSISSSAAFAIESTVGERDDGPEVLFLAAAIPEPSAFLFGAMVSGVLACTYVARRYRGKQSTD